MSTIDFLRHKARLGWAYRLAAVALVVAVVAIGGTRMSAWAEEKKSAEMPQIKVRDKDLPFEHKLTLAKGKAAILTLPNGKDVAFWCQGGHPLFDDTGLTLGWAEKPFQRLEINRKRMPDGGEVLTDWKSYIRQGGVTTSSNEPGSERELFVDKYCIVLKDNGDVKGALPVTVQVRLATEKELLHGDAEREHYRNQLKSEDATKRLAAIAELQEMASLGSIYAGDPKDMIAAMRPLTEDRDPHVKAAAQLYLCEMGDEKSLLALVTPEPKGKWRGTDGASRIADWCVRHKSPTVSKHVLTFFESKDEALLAFAVTFFARTDDPTSKPQMVAALKHKSSTIRATVVPAIRFLCTPKETAGYIVALLHDPSKQVVHAALLEANWVNQEIPAVEITRLLTDADPEVRRMAAYALDCCRDPAAIEPLLAATKDADARVRAQAAVTLGRIATPKAYGRLLELLHDDNAEVRSEAINGLRWLNDVRAIPHLQKLLKEEKDRDTRNMAERTIRELKSKHSPFSFW
ncbi:MAG: HEAT repeat domain-containing protein [Thermoguttaceae bacterium]